MALRISVFLFALVFLSGCSGGDSQKRFRLTGAATFDGKPIPFGEVLFTPDGNKGNSGAQGIAPIRDGKFDTSMPDGKGIGGGPMMIRVTGFSGPGGKLLCEFETQANLPLADGKHDILIPKEAANPVKSSEI